MSLDSHDLAAALRAFEGQTVAAKSLALPGFEAELVHVPAGMRYEHSASTASTLMVLTGVGTIALDDWRTTLAGGHLLGVPLHARLLITADSGVPLDLLLTRASQPAAPAT